MTRSIAASDTTSTVVRILIAILAVLQGIIGVWASLAPTSFYSNFPIAGHNWVSLLPPYNEHLIRDVGELSLALAVVLAAAALTCHRLLSVVAAGAVAIYAVPHAVFHFVHLQGFPTSDAIAQTAGIALQLMIIAIVAWLLWHERAQTK